ncbi:MAG: polysaccharide biosynthesis/export family protein [Kiritimatiellia bacterium]
MKKGAAHILFGKLVRGTAIAAVIASLAGAGCLPGGPSDLRFGGWRPASADVDLPEQRWSPLGFGDKVVVQIETPQGARSKQAVVDQNGEINLHLIGRVSVNGMAASEAARFIEQRYVEGGIYPSVNVSVLKQSDVFFVTGEIRKPGKYELTGQTTLMKAIAQAGGFTEFAWRSRVQIQGRKTETFDTGAIKDGVIDDPVVRSGDIVFVPETPF